MFLRLFLWLLGAGPTHHDNAVLVGSVGRCSFFWRWGDAAVTGHRDMRVVHRAKPFGKDDEAIHNPLAAVLYCGCLRWNDPPQLLRLE